MYPRQVEINGKTVWEIADKMYLPEGVAPPNQQELATIQAEAAAITQAAELAAQQNAAPSTRYFRSSATSTQSTAGTYTTPADFTGHTVKAGKTYRLNSVIRYVSAATTTALRPRITGPAMTEITYSGENETAATASERFTGITINTPIPFTASRGATVGRIVIESIFTPSADGTVNIDFTTEVSASAVTVQIGSYMVVEEIS